MLLTLLSAALAAEPVPLTEALARRIVDGEVTFSPAFEHAGFSGMYQAREADPGGWRGPSVRLSTGEVLRIDDCGEFYESLRSGRAVTWGRVWPITVDLGRLRAGEVVMLDESRGCRRVAQDEGYDSSAYTVLSVVGPLVTVEQKWSGMGGGGPPYHSTGWSVLDARGEAPSLGEVVDEAALMDALRADPFLRAERPDLYTAEVDPFADFAAFDEALSAEGYAFYAWDPDADRVAVRLAVRPWGWAGLAPNEVTQLGVWVTPSEALRSWLVAEEGFLMSAEGIAGRDLRLPPR